MDTPITIEAYPFLMFEKERGGNDMKATTIRFKSKAIPVLNYSTKSSHMELLTNKLSELELDFEFRKKLKMISLIEIIGDVAIFKYHDGTKLYLEVS
jgi:hypothetical protein